MATPPGDIARKYIRDPTLLRFIDLECYIWSTVSADMTPMINAGMVGWCRLCQASQHAEFDVCRCGRLDYGLGTSSGVNTAGSLPTLLYPALRSGVL
jgi:hypothetical protein